MRKRASEQVAALPVGGLCEFVDAGDGVALLRLVVPGCPAPDHADLHADGERFIPLLQPDYAGAGEVPAAFAGPLDVLRRPGVQIVLRGADGLERLLPAPVERECAPARQEALIEQLRRRCELSERALRDARADLGESARLVKAWAEAGELRELLEVRAASDKMLETHLAEARSDLERSESVREELESAFGARTAERDELLRRAAAAERVARLRAADVDRLERRHRADVERLQHQLETRRPDFERAMLREGKRRELRLRCRVEELERQLADRDRRLSEIDHPLAPSTALRQLAVAVAGSAEAAARSRGGDAPTLTGRSRRRFAR